MDSKHVIIFIYSSIVPFRPQLVGFFFFCSSLKYSQMNTIAMVSSSQ